MVRIILLASLVFSSLAMAEKANDQVAATKSTKPKKKAKKEEPPVLILNLEGLDLYSEEIDKFVETQTDEGKPQPQFRPDAKAVEARKNSEARAALLIVHNFNNEKEAEERVRQYIQGRDYSELAARLDRYRAAGFSEDQIAKIDPGQGNVYGFIKDITGKQPADSLAFLEVRPYDLFASGASLMLVIPFQPRQR